MPTAHHFGMKQNLEKLLYNKTINIFTHRMGGEEMDIDMEIDEVSRIIRDFLNVNVAVCKDCREAFD